MNGAWAAVLAALITVTVPAVGAALHYLIKSAREMGRASLYREQSEATIAEKNLQLTQQRDACAAEKAELRAIIDLLRAERSRERPA